MPFLLKTKYVFLIIFYFLQIKLCSTQNNCTPGKITDTIYCNTSKTNSYAIYLPLSYSNAHSKYPVLYLHDPAARASQALQVFIQAAEKNHFILVCSNVTNNFGSTDSMILQSIEMQQHVEAIFNVDTTQRYIGGFSGGSRLAFAIANTNKNYAGILACGAGLPARIEQVQYIPINSIVATAYGNTDMNYLEMINLKQLLHQQQRIVKGFEFEGGHEWPSPSIAIDILDWFTYHTAKSNATQNVFLDSILNTYESEMKNYLYSENYFAAFQIYADHAIEFSDSNKYDSLFLSEPAHSSILSIQKIFDLETEQRNLYTEFITNRIFGSIIYDSSKLKNDMWWKQKTNQIKKKIESSNQYESESASRLFDVLWRSCWENGDFFFQDKKYKEAKSLYYLLVVIYPENPYAWIYLAKAEAMLNNDLSAISFISKGIEKGFVQYDYLLSDPAFIKIRETKKFKKTIASIAKETTVPNIE